MHKNNKKGLGKHYKERIYTLVKFIVKNIMRVAYYLTIVRLYKIS